MKRFYWIPLLLFALILAGCAAATDPSAPTAATEAAPADPTAATEHAEESEDHHPALTPVTLAAGEKLRVVATTNLVADVVGRVGGDAIDLIGLLPPGADPHSYQATPNDLRAISDAHLLFVNGLGLEEALESVLDEAQARTVSVNEGVALITEEEEEEEEGHEDHAEEEHHHSGANPHTWWSIAAVEGWTHNIADSLAAVDPANAETYAANATAYKEELAGLASELAETVAQIPPAERKLATDHDTLAYFARDFDFQVVGLIVPSFSTLAEPSAQHLAALQDEIRAQNVRVIVVGSTVNPRQAEQLAADVGIQVAAIFTDSLSEADGPAPTYLDFMRYNVGVIVAALGGTD